MSRWAAAAGWLFALGTVLFSGSLYVLALTGVSGWGAVTPPGGLAWLAGWAALALTGLKRRLVVVEIEEDRRVLTVQAGGEASGQPAETER